MPTSLERRIIIGLIVSTEYIQKIRPMWNISNLQSSAARRLASWCIEYYDEYEKAPFKDIEGIYTEKLKAGNLPKDLAEEIEEDILPGLSEEYEQEKQFNLDYLYAQTKKYFHERHLSLHSEEIQSLVDEGNLTEAEALAETYKGQIDIIDEGLDLGSEQALVEVDNAFNRTIQQVVTYPGALGEMWNDQFVRGGLVGFMGPEKRGKTFLLLEIAMRAITKKASVAFFQAGDMTESQQLKRICVYLAKKSDKIKYCQQLYIPVKDCLLSQLDLCDKDDRESDVGPLEHLHKPDDKNIWKARKRINFQELFTAYQKEPDYSPCYNCRKWKEHGAVWLKPRPPVAPLRASEAKKALSKFFQKYKRSFKLSSHVSGTLSVKGIRGILSIWEQQDGFVPDVVLVDYADLLTDETTDFRHRQNEIWKGLRGLAQERHCLVVTVTQTDADSYGRDRLRLGNFSEDKRKYAHVTAMYGLNQDKDGREKAMGLMVINELVIREGEFSSKNEVYVMQKLQMGRPFLGSFK